METVKFGGPTFSAISSSHSLRTFAVALPIRATFYEVLAKIIIA